MFGRAGVGGTGARATGRSAASRASATSSTRSSAATPRPARVGATAGRRRPALRPAPDLRRGHPRHREGDHLRRAGHAARSARGTGAEPGTEPITCPQCSGSGEIRQVRSTMLGQMVNVTTCAALPRIGPESSRRRATTAAVMAGIERKKTLRVSIPPGIDDGHQIRLSGEGEAGPRGGTSGNLYVVTHVDEHPVLKREDTELYLRAARCRSPRPRSGRRCRSSRRTARSSSTSSPGPSPAPRSGGAARACRTSAGRASAATSTSSSTSRCRPTSRTRERELYEQLAVEAGELEPGEARPATDGAPRGSHDGRPAPRASAEALARRPHQGRDRLSTSARWPDGTSAAGTWLELSVEADLEAVEAVSEILARAAPAGVSVETPFTTADEGLAAAIDPTRPATRAGLPAGPRSDRRGSLGARGRGAPRAPPGVRPAADRRAARSRSSTRRTGRAPGRSTSRCSGSGAGSVIRPTWRRASTPPRARSSSASTRGWPSGRGCIRRRDSASPVSSDGPTRASWRAPRSWTWAPGRGSWRSGPRSWARARSGGSTPTRSRSSPPRRTPPATTSGSTSRRGSLPVAGGPFDLVLANLVAGLLVDLASELAAAVRPGDGRPRSWRSTARVGHPRSTGSRRCGGRSRPPVCGCSSGPTRPNGSRSTWSDPVREPRVRCSRSC